MRHAKAPKSTFPKKLLFIPAVLGGVAISVSWWGAQQKVDSKPAKIKPTYINIEETGTKTTPADYLQNMYPAEPIKVPVVDDWPQIKNHKVAIKEQDKIKELEKNLKINKEQIAALKKAQEELKNQIPAPGSTTQLPAVSVNTDTDLLALVTEMFPANEVGNAMAVADCESGQKSVKGATNSNGTTDWGLFQLNDGGTLQGGLRAIGVPFSSTQQAQQLAMDPRTNVRVAAYLFSQRKWAPWVCASKLQITDGLYSSQPGPMYGKYAVR